MKRNLVFIAVLLLSLPAAVWAQGAQDLAEAQRLRSEASALFEAKDFLASAAKYEDAIRAWEAALGKDKPDCLKEVVAMRRAIAWCRTQSGDFPALPAAFEAFFGAAHRLGGYDKEEESVLDCLKWTMLALAARKDDAGMEAAHAGFDAAAGKTLQAVRSDKAREKDLQFFADRLELLAGRALEELGEGYFKGGFRDKALMTYGRAANRWQERRQHARLCWCHARAGNVESLKKGFQAFYDAVLFAGGNEEGETLVRTALYQALEDLALKPDEKEIQAVAAAYADALRKAAQAAKKDGRRAKELEPFVARTEGFLGNGQEYLATTLLAAGNREKGTQEYRKAVKYWEDRKDYLAASWTPTNVFFEMTLYKRTEVADFLLVDALQAVRKHRYAKVESALSIHLRNFLNKLLEEKKADEAIRFLESAIVLGKTSGAFPAGMDEGNLRQGLDEFLWMKEAWDKVVTNGEALARLGREAKYPYREALGSFFAGWGSLKKGANADALARFEACIAVAGPAGDAMRLGYGWVGKCRALSAVGKYEEADAAARKGMEIYEEAGIGTGVTQARKAALENARAWSNQDKTEGYKRLVRNLSAAGPMGGVSLGAMAAADLARRVEGLEKATDVLEISRQENRLAFRNLLDGSSADVTLDPHFHYVNVSGVLFQVKGPELLLWSITADGGAPNAPGETTDVSGEDVIHECADFSNFGQRHLADPGSLLRVTSSAQLYRVKRP